MSYAQPTGWYYAAGDPPGTVRYWDGEQWVGDPVAPPATAAPGYVPHQQYPEGSTAVVAFVLSLVGLVSCLLFLSPIGWTIAHKELKGIAAGRRDPNNRNLAIWGKWLGIIGTALLAMFVGFIVWAVITAP